MTLDNLRVNYKVPLSVQFIAAHLNAGKIPADIARIAGVSDQAVSDYIKRHFDKFEVMCDKNDTLLKMQVKLNAYKAGELLNVSLNALDLSTPEKAAKHLVPLNIVAGTQTQRLNELSGRIGNTVINVQTVITDAQSRLQSIEQQQAAIADRIKLIK